MKTQFEDIFVLDEKEKAAYAVPATRTIAITMVLAFVVPVVIMAFAFLQVQVCPGGKFTLFVYDLAAQFSPVIASMRYLFNSENSLFLSFFGALGNSAFLNYASYVLDPTMWITIAFPLERLSDAIYFITLFKMGLCGVSLSIYLFFGSREKKYPFVIVILSTCYALMSYNVMYSQCLLWFNVVALAPVVLLGIERIIEGKKGFIYILGMTLSLFYNYQMAYMIGIFGIMYLIWRMTQDPGKLKMTTGRFVFCNILCGGLFLPVFIPVIFNVLNGRMKTYNSMAGRFLYYPIWNEIKQFMSCQYDTIASGGLPLLFCGTFIPILALCALLLPVRPFRTRLISACIVVFFLASFCIVPLNQFWHGFNEPNAFPARYSFLFCLFLIILAYQTVCFIFEKKDINGIGMYILCGIAMIIACMELFLNAGFILTSLNLEMGYGIDVSYQRQITNMRDALDHIEDDDFYRIGRDLPYSFNDGMLMGYNGIGYFSSMFERNTMDFIGQLGYSQFEHTVRDVGGTPLAESLLGVRYKLLREPGLFGYYESVYHNNIYDLQYNKDALPLGFLMKYKGFDPNSDEELAKGVNEHNSFVYQEYILSELSGKRVHAFENIDYSIEEVESDDFARRVRMKFTAKDSRPVWIYCSDEHGGGRFAVPDDFDKISSSDQEFPETSGTSQTSSGESEEEEPVGAFLEVNGNTRFPFVDRISTMCIYLGTFEEGEEVEVEAGCVSAFDDPWIAYYNEDECVDALSTIKETGFVVTEHRNGVVRGHINVRDENDLMVMTLPYMRGYRVKVDGISTDYGAYRNTLFALKMEPGEHTVEISFVPYGLIPGSVIGLIFLAGTILYLRRH